MNQFWFSFLFQVLISKYKIVRGWQASWLEKDCADRDHRRALCESTDPSCEQSANNDPHVLTEGELIT